MRSGTLNQEELIRLSRYLAEENEIKDQVIIGILSTTDIKLKELVDLKVSDIIVNNENGIFEIINIVISRKKKKTSFKVEEILGKTLSEYLRFRSYKSLQHDYLLFNERLGPFTRSGIYRKTKKMLNQAKIRDASIRNVKQCYEKIT